MSYYPYAAIELAMIKRVADASKANTQDDPPKPFLGYRLRQVESYDGQLHGGPKRIAEAVREVPAVWICFENARPRDGGNLWLGTFSAVCVARNARNNKAARHGAGDAEVGAYQIGRDVAGLLDEQTFGIANLSACQCTMIDAPFNAEFEGTRAAIVLLQFSVGWDADSDFRREPDTRPQGLFATFNVDWDIPPFTDPAPAIPVDDATQRDARDVVHPEQE